MTTLTDRSASPAADRSSFLRRVLWADAATCLATGLLLTLDATPLAALFGLPADLLTYAGLSLFPCAALMIWIATRESIWRLGAWTVILGNAAWVAGSVAVLVLLSPTGLGYAFVIAQAVAVAVLAELEYAGVKKLA
jgi:hypothetical protein